MPIVDETNIIAHVHADLARGTVNPVQVDCTQYDAEMRVIAVHLRENNRDWAIPSGYAVNVRMRKADGTSVYNPQQGEGNIAYITLSAQMCGVAGTQYFVVEIVKGDDVVQTVPIRLNVRKNPIEDKDFTSEDEKETIQQAVKDAQDAAEESQENANQAYTWNQNCITIYHQTENLKNDTQTLHDQAQTAATTAQEMAAQVEDYAEKVLGISVPAVALSQSEYDALNPPDPKTIYIVESDGPQNSLVANYPLTQNLSDGMDGSKVATATGCQGLGNWDGTGPSFNTAPASGAVGQHQNYLTLPFNLLSGMSFSNGITLAVDLKPSATAAAGNGDWTRLINLYKHSNSPAGTAEGELYLTQGLIATAYYDGVTDQYLDASKAALITAGTWHTVAVVLSATELIVYLDGTRIGSVNNTGNLLEQLPYMDTNEIGNSRFADKDFSGLLRNFRIYDKAMSAAEIGQLNQASTWKLYYGAAQDSTLAQLQEAVDTLTESVSTAQEDIQKAQEDISALQSAMEKIEDGTTELPYLKTSGGTMTGDVDMDGNAITGLPNPATDTDAIPKGWADGQYTPLTAAIRPTVTGNPIHIEDSAEAPVQGLCVYGKTTQDGTPSTENPVPLVSAEDVSVTVCGKNLVGDGNLIKYGYISNNDGSITTTRNGILYSPFIPAKGMSKIVFSIPAYNSEDVNVYGLRLGLYKNGEWIKNILIIASNLGQPIDLEDADNIRISVPESFLENFQVEFSETATAYEPYTGKTLTLTGDLPGIPVDSGGNYTDPDGQQWVCDTVDVVAKQKIQRISIIDSYNGESVGDVWMSTTGQLSTGAKVVYRLDEPITSQISIDKPTTYDGTTNVTATDGAGLSLRYIADTQKYIDNKIAALSAAMLEG